MSQNETIRTKITTANIRIALSYQYSTFEISANLENIEGITADEINKVRQDVQLLANDAVNAFKAQPNPDLKIAIRNAENQIKQIKDMAENVKPEKPTSPDEIKAVEAFPLYTEVKKSEKKPIDKKK